MSTHEEAMCAAPTVDERIEALRRDVNALFRLIPDELEQRLERDRQARWQATHNAYVAGRGPEDADADVEVWAKAFADRAHGPLEAGTAAEGTITGSTSVGRGGESPESSSAALRASQVTALVKALKMFNTAFDNAKSDWGPDAARAAVAADNALKPFEQGVSDE